METRRRYLTLLILVTICVLIVMVAGVWAIRRRDIPFVGRKEQWSIGIYRGSSPYTFPAQRRWANPVLTAQDVTDLPAKFVADPFLAREGSTWYLFFEVYNSDTQQGDIAVASSQDTRRWRYDRVVLDEPFHLSYPYVFGWEGDYYLIPESFEANAIRLYKAIDFPRQWSFVGNLIENKDFVDPSIVHFDGKWWIFVSTVAEGDALRLYYADDLMGPWIEHPKSPVARAGENMARPGGRVLEYEGQIIRYQQDLDSTWNHQLWAFEVTELTMTTYEEKRLSAEPILAASGSGWNEKAMHHIDPHQIGEGEWIASVDGFGTRLVFGLEY